ncbi:MAG: M1 family metallopeptidase [Anaerolineaceae bacterium]|nr:M1 family metallopeptidase [Anaerolineaceae bacterium]
MKRLFLLLIVGILLMSACNPVESMPSDDQSEANLEPGNDVAEEEIELDTQSNGDQDDQSPKIVPTHANSEPLQSSTLFKRDWKDRELFKQDLLESEQNILSGLQGAAEYHIDITIPSHMDFFEGKQEVFYTNRETVALEEIYLHTYPAHSGAEVEISNVSINGSSVEFEQQFDDQAIYIPLTDPLYPQGEIILKLDFKMTLPHDMGGNYGLYGFFEDYLVLDLFYPMIAVYDDEGWNVKDLADWGDLTYLDSSFYMVRVQAPKEMNLATTGFMLEQEIEGKNQITTFAAGPARDFYIAGSEKFEVESTEVVGVLVNSYSDPEFAEGRAFVLHVAENALKSFNERFGDYPYHELDLIGTPMLAGGIEYPGIVALALEYYDPNGTVAGFPNHVFLETATAHEVGHQWFYNMVGNDQVDEPWLDEAVTQYVTSKYYEDVHSIYNANQYRASWYNLWDRVEKAEIPVGLSTLDYEGNQYAPIVYGRGPLFIMDLEHEVGEEIMKEFMKTYSTENRWEIATGEVFINTFEEICNCDTSELLDKWLYE